MLPGGRAALRDDLRHFAGLDTPPETSEIDLCLSQATVRAALGDRRALAQAEEIVARWPELVRAHVVNARVKLALGQAEAARGAAEAGLALEPADCRLLEVKARARLSEGAAREALVLLEQAGRSGMTPTLHATLARANRAAKNWKASLRAWNAQVGVDPQNPEWYLCRARVARRLGMVEQALADLEVAADLAEPSRADLMARIAFEYAGCARGRKHRVDRVAYLAKRVIRGD